jgi:osmotically-inducible protein OsmY
MALSDVLRCADVPPNHRITDSGIKVASVNKGVVLLSGKTKSLEAHAESVQVAYAVRGVRRVSTEVEVDSLNP